MPQGRHNWAPGRYSDQAKHTIGRAIVKVRRAPTDRHSENPKGFFFKQGPVAERQIHIASYVKLSFGNGCPAQKKIKLAIFGEPGEYLPGQTSRCRGSAFPSTTKSPQGSPAGRPVGSTPLARCRTHPTATGQNTKPKPKKYFRKKKNCDVPKRLQQVRKNII